MICNAAVWHARWERFVDARALAIKQGANLTSEMYFGFSSFCETFALIFSSWSLLSSCLKHTPKVLAGVLLLSCSYYLLGLPLRLLKLQTVDWNTTLQLASMQALGFVRIVLPRASDSAFFAVLRLRDQELADELKSMPVKRSWRSQAQQLLWHAVASAVLLLVVIAKHASVLMLLKLVAVSALAAGLAFLASTWMMLIPLVLVSILALSIFAGFSMMWYRYMQPFLTLWRKVDPVVAFLGLMLTALRVMRISDIATLLRYTVILYVSCKVLTHQMLSQYENRLDREAWTSFRKQHKWRLLGFALPIWMTVQLLPPVAVALLEVFHGVAGGLLADLLPITSIGHKDVKNE
mmetsp:Transcript_76286/g.135113  ORF Transcript_76286/g.135113 Transcript_76286/m.135113 type:complete len:350 (-) Transcript_76286:86-1135(-)